MSKLLMPQATCKSKLVINFRAVYRQTKKNEEFEMFFKDFKKKNKGKWESIINGMEINDEVLKAEANTDKQEEIEMLEEFERRRKFKAAYETNEKVKTTDPTSTSESLPEKNKATNEEEMDEVEEVLKPDVENGEIYDSK